jgi:hypothetical protein
MEKRKGIEGIVDPRSLMIETSVRWLLVLVIHYSKPQTLYGSKEAKKCNRLFRNLMLMQTPINRGGCGKLLPLEVQKNAGLALKFRRKIYSGVVLCLNNLRI